MARVLVAGGAGGVGEGIVRHLLRAGHFVVVPSRSQAKSKKKPQHAGTAAAQAGVTAPAHN